MNQSYIYRAYGLIIEAEFPLPELEVGEGRPDVIIRYGEVPQTIAGAPVRMVRFEAAPGRFLQKVDGIARYYVQDGKEVIVEPHPGSTDKDIRLFLLGSVFGALMHQRGNLVLHGAAVAVHGSGIVFTGVSGSGKSTLAAGLYQKGYPVITDDICVVIHAQNTHRIVPGFPRLALWADAAGELGENVADLARVREKLNKYALRVEDKFCREPLPISRVYVLSPNNSIDVCTTRLSGSDKIKGIVTNTYRRGFLEGRNEKSLHFQQCTALVQAVDVYLVNRPEGRLCIDQLTKLMEGELSSL
jgi:hypothetical protein